MMCMSIEYDSELTAGYCLFLSLKDKGKSVLLKVTKCSRFLCTVALRSSLNKTWQTSSCTCGDWKAAIKSWHERKATPLRSNLNEETEKSPQLIEQLKPLTFCCSITQVNALVECHQSYSNTTEIWFYIIFGIVLLSDCQMENNPLMRFWKQASKKDTQST